MSKWTVHDTKERIREAVDIVDLVGAQIDLRRQGRLYVGLCPWHEDSRPSLQVNPERQSWKCWVCDLGGDIFSFVMQREGVAFPEALRMLAERAGIPLADSGPRQAAKPGSADDKPTLYQAMSWASEQYHQCLLGSADAAVARQYLEDRGIQRESMQRFHLGFAPNQWQWLTDRARTTSFSPPVLEAVGLALRSPRSGKYFDRFRGRVLFPIRDPQGRAIALGGRILPQFQDDKSAKYINSPETRLFSKSEQLYGLDTIRDAVARSRHVIIVEGYTDAVMAWQHGIDNVAAVLGTALGSRHIQLLRRFADKITLVLDGDEAGQRRTAEILELFIAHQVDLRIATLPEGLDPCDFLLQRGVDTFRQFVAEAVDALEHKVRITTAGFDPLHDTHRANQALETLLQTLAKAPRLQSGTTSPIRIRQEQILSRLARVFRVDEPELRLRLTALRSKARRPVAGNRSQPPATAPGPLNSIERELLELLTQYPRLAQVASQAIAVDELDSPAARVIYAKFIGPTPEPALADFQRVLIDLDDPKLKSLLVQLDEEGRRKAEADPDQRLRDVIRAYRARQSRRAGQAAIAQLEHARLDEEKEMELLSQIIAQNRERQGISAPKDG